MKSLKLLLKIAYYRTVQITNFFSIILVLPILLKIKILEFVDAFHNYVSTNATRIITYAAFKQLIIQYFKYPSEPIFIIVTADFNITQYISYLLFWSIMIVVFLGPCL